MRLKTQKQTFEKGDGTSALTTTLSTTQKGWNSRTGGWCRAQERQVKAATSITGRGHVGTA